MAHCLTFSTISQDSSRFKFPRLSIMEAESAKRRKVLIFLFSRMISGSRLIYCSYLFFPPDFPAISSRKKSAEHFDGATRAKDLNACKGISLPEFFYFSAFLSHFVAAMEAVKFSAIRTFHPTFILKIIHSAGITFFFLHVVLPPSGRLFLVKTFIMLT